VNLEPELPLALDGRFQLWVYSVSMSRLILRSFGSPSSQEQAQRRSSVSRRRRHARAPRLRAAGGPRGHPRGGRGNARPPGNSAPDSAPGSWCSESIFVTAGWSAAQSRPRPTPWTTRTCQSSSFTPEDLVQPEERGHRREPTASPSPSPRTTSSTTLDYCSPRLHPDCEEPL
jgi:hypothetical protein